MTEIESELGKTTLGGQQRQVLNVEDHSDIPQKPVRMSPQQAYQQVSGGAPDFMPAPQQSQQEFYAQQSMPPQRSFETTKHELSKIEQMRSARGKRELSPEAKRRVEFLTGIGRLMDEFEVEGVKFTIQTLKTREMKEVAKVVSSNEIDPAEFAYELRSNMLARSVVKINDHLVEEILGDDSFEAKLALIEELDESVTIHIYDKYQAMADKSREKYGINTDKDVSEVSEAIKKA